MGRGGYGKRAGRQGAWAIDFVGVGTWATVFVSEEPKVGTVGSAACSRMVAWLWDARWTAGWPSGGAREVSGTNAGTSNAPHAMSAIF